LNYDVVTLRRAQLDINRNAIWWAENRDVDQAILWIEGIREAIADLSQEPERHAIAPESEWFGFPVRQMLFGIGKKPTHRVVFRIREERVLVHAVRHLHQRELSLDEFLG